MLLWEGRDATICPSTAPGHSGHGLCGPLTAKVTMQTRTRRPCSAGPPSGLSMHVCQQPPREEPTARASDNSWQQRGFAPIRIKRRQHPGRTGHQSGGPVSSGPEPSVGQVPSIPSGSWWSALSPAQQRSKTPPGGGDAFLPQAHSSGLPRKPAAPGRSITEGPGTGTVTCVPGKSPPSPGLTAHPL